MSMISPRSTIFVAACIVAGVFINLFVAWSLELVLIQKHHLGYPIVTRAHGPRSDSGHWLTDIKSFPYAITVAAVWSLGDRFEEFVGEDGEVRTIARDGPEAVPTWSMASGLFPQSTPGAEMYYEFAAGWPLISWYGVYEHQAESTRWALKMKSAYFYRHPVLFPFRPIPKGFLVNTTLYALLFAILLRVLLVAFHWANQRQRISRGLCPHCAYDITGLTTCPECGQPVASKA